MQNTWGVDREVWQYEIGAQFPQWYESVIVLFSLQLWSSHQPTIDSFSAPGHHRCEVIYLDYVLKRRGNETLQHLAIDVCELDTFNPSFYQLTGDDSFVECKRNIYIRCFLNRFCHLMKQGHDRRALKSLCNGLSSTDDPWIVSATYLCLKAFPGVVSNSWRALSPASKQVKKTVPLASHKDSEANNSTSPCTPPPKRQKTSQ